MILARCHPEKAHHSRGLCGACYKRELKRRNPAYREAERSRSREYHHQHRSTRLVQQKEYRSAHADDVRQRNAEYYESHRDGIRMYRSERWRVGLDRRNHPPEMRAAHQAVAYALAQGMLTSQPCVQCGRENVHAHHDDYSKPLDVMWLCPRHHTERHEVTA